MLPRRLIFALLLVLPLSLAGQSRDTLPASLTDREFWELSERLSEPGGFFRSGSGSPDNLLSNEAAISTVAAQVAERLPSSGVYLGVGPEQNFTYIAAMKPRMAFITDIRRGNWHLHLMYKAIFEMSPTRADFVARLFTRTRPAGLTTESSARQLMDAYLSAPAGDEAAFAANLKAITDHLMKTRNLPLSEEDRDGIKYVLHNFSVFGPAIHYTSSIGGNPRTAGTYAVIQSSIDRASGMERTYLATEANYTFVKTMESKNLIVPVVGDFAGPKALRAIGAYLKERSATVTAFYLSNVEDYLRRSSAWTTFCGNVATMPLDDRSSFIRNNLYLGTMQSETIACR